MTAISVKLKKKQTYTTILVSFLYVRTIKYTYNTLKDDLICLFPLLSKNPLANPPTNPPAAFQFYTPGPTLSCSEKSWFWVSWRYGAITLGTGDSPGYNSVLIFYDTSPIQINYMSVSTYSGNGTSNWTIPAEFYTTSRHNLNE